MLQGSKELFEGLYIYDKWNWEAKHPVIRIDLNNGNYATAESIVEILNINLQSNADRLGVEYKQYSQANIGASFADLIQQTKNKYNTQVAVLIDEYDKPILDNITNKTQAAVARDVLRNFYGAIKPNDSYLRHVFITGVSKFSKLNLFSGLNNLEDITIDQRYATITGYTHHDIETTFSDYTQGVDLEEVRRWYNGYNYLGEPVYNPFDVLLFFSKDNTFDNYWWETGNPKFLIDKLVENPQRLPNLQNIKVSKNTLNNFDVEHIDLVALLWQTGYLTFDSKEVILGVAEYKMKVPNKEVQLSLNGLFFDYLTKLGNESTLKTDLAKLFLKADMQGVEQHLISLFASIPNTNYIKNNISRFEGYYASVMYAFLCSIGFDVRAEDYTSEGRIDMTLIGPDQIFILEFKVDQPAEKAIQQIKAKRYYEKYTAQGKGIYLIGIHFSSEKRNLTDFKWETLK